MNCARLMYQIVADFRCEGPCGLAPETGADASTRFARPSETEVQKWGCNGVEFQGFWLEGAWGEEVLERGEGCVGSGWFFASYGFFSPFFTCFSPPISVLSGLYAACYIKHTPINDTQCKIKSSKFNIEGRERHELQGNEGTGYGVRGGGSGIWLADRNKNANRSSKSKIPVRNCQRGLPTAATGKGEFRAAGGRQWRRQRCGNGVSACEGNAGFVM